MYSSILFFTELLILFFLSQSITKLTSSFLLRLTHSYKLTIKLLALLFLPGVILHETSHYLMAKLLFVHVEHMEFLPQVHGESVKLGSVTIHKTDPLRKLLIGIAPTVSGLIVLSLIFRFGLSLSIAFNWQTMASIYGIVEITATMFSSKKDIEGSFILIGAIIICLVLWLVFIPSAGNQVLGLLSFFKPFFESGVKILSVLLVVDGVLYIAGRLLLA